MRSGSSSLVGDNSAVCSVKFTKEGKLVTLDFDPKFQPTQKEPVESKVADIGLGSSAVVQYTKQGEKNVATNIEYVPAKGE